MLATRALAFPRPGSVAITSLRSFGTDGFRQPSDLRAVFSHNESRRQTDRSFHFPVVRNAGFIRVVLKAMHLLVQGTEGGHDETLPAPSSQGVRCPNPPGTFQPKGQCSARRRNAESTSISRRGLQNRRPERGLPSEPRPGDRWGRRTWGARGRARRRRAASGGHGLQPRARLFVALLLRAELRCFIHRAGGRGRRALRHRRFPTAL